MATATPETRDDFTTATRRVIAERSGYMCAIRGCATAGPTRDPNDSVNIGEAGHITAASRRGPRYDPSMSADDRKSATNGIWCCRNCHGLVDGDESRFTREELVRLKAAAERRAEERQGIANEQGPDLQAALSAARSASQRLLTQWRTIFQFNQAEVIELDLRESGTAGSADVRWTVPQLADAIKANRKVVLSGHPGAGKTITLLQAAQRLAGDEAGPIPLLVSVNAWASSNQDLAGYITQRLTALGVPAAGVPLLFATGRLALLLNGWNEAPDSEQAQAGARIQDFLLNQPLTAIAVTTRAVRNAPSLALPCKLKILPLTAVKRNQIVRAAGLPHLDAFLREIEGNAALREIVQTPIFLAAAIKLARAGRAIPASRSGLLESFVRDFESTDNHATALQSGPCHDFHHRYLSKLAAAMTRAGTTALSAARTQESIAACSASLVASRHLGTVGAATAIADDLVRHHLLVLQPDVGASYRFIHQQFQEWFAGRWLAGEIRTLAANPAADRIFAFQRDILNRPPWDEALRFAMEELIAAGDVAIAAALVNWMASVDLLIASELAAIGGDALWREVGGELARKLRAWHALGDNHAECARAAASAIGRGEFADLFWPELEADEQTMLRALRNHSPFRIKILGDRWQERVAQWPTDREVTLLGDITHSAGADEKEYAETRARSGPPEVRTAALRLLAYQEEFARAARVMSATRVAEWPEDWYHEVLPEFPAAALQPFVSEIRAKFETTDSISFRHGIIRVLANANHADWIALAQGELVRVHAESRRTPTTPRGRFDRPATLGQRVANEYLEMLGTAQSAWVDEWLVANGVEDLLWEDPHFRRVEQLAEPLLVRVAQHVMGPGGRRVRHYQAVRHLLASQSTAVANALLDACLAGLAEPDGPPTQGGEESAADRRRWFRNELRDAPIGSLVEAMVDRAGRLTDYRSLAAFVELLGASTALDESLRSRLSVEQRDGLRALIRRVSELMPDDQTARHERPGLAVMLGGLGAPEDLPLVETWIAEEHARWEAHLRGNAEARAARPPRQVRHYGTSWWSWYEGALALFGTPEAEAVLQRWLDWPEFATVGAAGLLHMSLIDGSLPRLEEGTGRRRPRTRGQPTTSIGPAVQRRADAVFRVIESLEAKREEDPDRRHLPELAAALGRLNDLRAVPRLLAANSINFGWTQIGVLRCLQLRGARLPGRQMADALEPYIAQHEVPPRNDRDSWHMVADALNLLLFSDDPAVGVDRIRRLPRTRLEAYYGRDVFVLLAVSTDPRAGDLLVEFSHTIPAASRSHSDLMDAMANSKHEACHRRLIEILRRRPEDAPDENRIMIEAGALQLAARSPAFATELIALVRANPLNRSLGRMAGLSPSEQMLDALLSHADLRPVSADLHELVDHLSYEETPARSPNHFYVWPADATTVKRKLAAVFAAGGSKAVVASRLLAFLRLKRHHRGQPPQEPLHPDISLLQQGGPSWPV